MPQTRRSVLAALASSAAVATLRPHLSFADQPPINDPLRPRFHYLPERNWINDPCAPVFYRGQYHMFHQYNPHASVWGDMHWAHASSPDMVHWTRLPVALAPTPGGPDSEGVFTGSSILRDGKPAVIYTGVQSVPLAEATLSDGTHNFRETQLLATSSDSDLRTWTKHPTPVIPTPPPGMKVTGFRDPCPFTHEGKQYLVVGSGQRGVGGMVLLYRAASPDLTQWEYLHPLTQGTTASPANTTSQPQLDQQNPTKSTPLSPPKDPVDTGEMWECPDFFALDGRHVLIYSTHRITFWQVGDLDTATLTFHATSMGKLDEGKSFYAPKTQLDSHGNRILWGWLAETRPEVEFAAAGWAGMISLPRVLNIRNGALTMRPLPALQQLRSPSLGGPVNEFLLAPDTNFQFKRNGPQTRQLAPRDAAGPLFGINYADGTALDGSDTNEVVITAPNLPAIKVALDSRNRTAIHAFIDNSVVELFLGDSSCITHRFYKREPTTPILTLTLPATYRDDKQSTYSLRSIWSA